jgi:hypothetical protein
MDLWTRRQRLGGLTILALLMLPACGGTDPTSVAPPATTETVSASPAPNSPRPEPKPKTNPNPPPKPEPNPNPPPGLVSYDLPQVGRDLDEQAAWTGSIADACARSGHKSDCLTLEYAVYLKNHDGSRTKISNPGPNYRDEDNQLYELCLVTILRPPPATPIEVGSVVTVEAECEPTESGSGDSSGSDSGGSDSGGSDSDGSGSGGSDSGGSDSDGSDSGGSDSGGSDSGGSPTATMTTSP